MKFTSARKRFKIRLGAKDVGQSLVEFTLVLPILLILLFAIVDFGRAFYTWNGLSNAAREGARVAAVGGNNSEINAAVTSAMGGLTTTSPTLTRTYTNVGGDKGETATVQLSYQFTYVTPISPLLSFIGGSSIANPTLTSTSAMRLE